MKINYNSLISLATFGPCIDQVLVPIEIIVSSMLLTLCSCISKAS